MTVECCSTCGLPFPFDVRSDFRIASYCDSLKHWQHADIDMDLCADNIVYLFTNFIPVTPEERATDALFRRMLAWLEDRSYP